MSGPLHAISTDYIPVIRNAILRPLLREDDDSIEWAFLKKKYSLFYYFRDTLEVYHAYDLVKEDLETINELGMWNEKDDLWGRVKSSRKAALTRALGKDGHKKHFATTDDIKIQARTGTSKRGAAKAAKDKLKAIAASDEEAQQGDEEDQADNEAEVQAEILDAY